MACTSGNPAYNLYLTVYPEQVSTFVLNVVIRWVFATGIPGIGYAVYDGNVPADESNIYGKGNLGKFNLPSAAISFIKVTAMTQWYNVDLYKTGDIHPGEYPTNFKVMNSAIWCNGGSTYKLITPVTASGSITID